MLRQGFGETYRALPLSYGPPDMEPTGLEPATTSVTGCSSTCIRSGTSQRARQGSARRCHAGFPVEDSNPRRSDVFLPAFARNQFVNQCPARDD